MFRTITVSLVMVFLAAGLPGVVSAQSLPTVKSMNTILTDEVSKMISAGHLRPTYVWGPDFRYNKNTYRDNQVSGITVQEFDDIFHNPADTIYTLAIAYPHVSASVQAQLRTYMQSEFETYKPYQYDHMGTAGNYREQVDVPSELRANYGGGYGIRSTPGTLSGFVGWTFNPFNYYALAKYAGIFNNASSILTLLSQNGHAQPAALPADDVIRPRPHVLNSYIAGYLGYQKLRELAGQAADPTIAGYLQTAMQKRVAFLPNNQSEALAVSSYESGGFLWLVPELGTYIRNQALARAQVSINTYKKALAYYMIPNVEEGTRLNPDFYNEGAHAQLYDESSLFLAQAFIEKKNKSELEALLHGPGTSRGDLFYIQNIVAAIEAPGDGSPTPTIAPITPTPTPKPGDANNDGKVDGVDYVTWLLNYGQDVMGPTVGDFNNNGRVDGIDYVVWLNNYDY